MKHILFSLFIVSQTLAHDTSVLDVIRANNLFAPAVYKEVAKTEPGNFLVSSFSAETVLAFLQSGAEGPTAEELRRGLQLPNNKTKVELGFKSLLPQLKGNNLYTFSTANKIYVRQNFAIRESFKTVATQVYYAESEAIDFSKNVEAAGKINQWVEKKTNNKIKNLINPDSLNSDTRVVLVNALYLKSNWSVPFPKPNTKKSNFFKTEAQVVQVDTLHHYSEHFNYFSCGRLKAQFLELKYQGGEASMIFALPYARNGLSELEKQVGEHITSGVNFTSRLLNVAIPKFKIETTIDFKQLLIKLGVQKIFSPNDVDLSGIACKKGDLVVDLVTQKTYITVEEGGVEAAAATVIGVSGTITSVNTETPTNFVADHPFIFWIKIKNVVVFTGRVTDPKY